MAGMSRTRRRPDPLRQLRKIIDLAETDPARFRAECRRVASGLGVGVEEVYALLQNDPLIRAKLRDVAIQGAAKLARRVLGL
jgi:hypothetical protein